LALRRLGSRERGGGPNGGQAGADFLVPEVRQLEAERLRVREHHIRFAGAGEFAVELDGMPHVYHD